jgi:opacity protein-like surface antigen
MMKNVLMAAAIAAAIAAAGAPARAVVVNEKTIETLVGQHFTLRSWALFRGCLDVLAAWSSFEHVDGGTGFTVTGIAHTSDFTAEAKIRLDDGRTGFFHVGLNSWNSDMEEAEENALIARNRAACAAKPEASIGMTETEVRASKWGSPTAVNTTELASGERAQWVYEYGPCQGGAKRGYLYFANGKLVAIQR